MESIEKKLQELKKLYENKVLELKKLAINFKSQDKFK